MQISIIEISMSLNGNLSLLRGITQPTERKRFKELLQYLSSKDEVLTHAYLYTAFPNSKDPQMTVAQL